MPQSSFRVIYILTPARYRTGGPEALHQLGRALVELGHDARIVYFEGEPLHTRDGTMMRFPEIDQPTPPDYDHYQVPLTWTIDDDPGNAVVFAERWPETARHFQHATKFLWWLSIDGALEAVRRLGGFDTIRNLSVRHLAQSFYAVSYLSDQGILSLPVFDYSSPEHTQATAETDNKRTDRVLFPARSFWFISYLQRIAPDLEWVQLKGFTSDQIQELFLTSKLYVDFGSHPGKDRMPREAAMLGCCVITGMRGSAANPFDVPIPATYKFRDSRRFNGRRIVRAIRQVLADYGRRKGDFAVYRQVIAGEQAEFNAQVRRAFGSRHRGLSADPQ